MGAGWWSGHQGSCKAGEKRRVSQSVSNRNSMNAILWGKGRNRGVKKAKCGVHRTHLPALVDLALDPVREHTTVCEDVGERRRGEGDESGEGKHL